MIVNGGTEFYSYMAISLATFETSNPLKSDMFSISHRIIYNK